MGDVETLESPAVFSNGVDRGLTDLLIHGNVEGQKVFVVLDQCDQSCIREALAVGQGKALNAGTDR